MALQQQHPRSWYSSCRSWGSAPSSGGLSPAIGAYIDGFSVSCLISPSFIMVFCYCNTLRQNPQEKDAIYRRLPKYESPAAAPHSGSSITMVSRYCPSSACAPGGACPPGCLRKEYAWIRLLTCRAQAAKTAQTTACWLPPVSLNTIAAPEVLLFTRLRRSNSCDKQPAAQAVQHHIAKDHYCGQGRKAPATENRLTTRPSVRYSVPNSCADFGARRKQPTTSFR